MRRLFILSLLNPNYNDHEPSQLKDWYIAVNFCPVPLSHTLGYPDDVPDFLFLQANVCVEDSKLELLHKCFLHQCHLR